MMISALTPALTPRTYTDLLALAEHVYLLQRQPSPQTATPMPQPIPTTTSRSSSVISSRLSSSTCLANPSAGSRFFRSSIIERS